MILPKLPSVFRSSRARGFDYQPVYYSEQKERLEKIKKRYDGEPQKVTKEGFRDNMRADWQKSRGKQVGSSNYRLFIIIGILSMLTYLIIRS